MFFDLSRFKPSIASKSFIDRGILHVFVINKADGAEVSQRVMQLFSAASSQSATDVAALKLSVCQSTLSRHWLTIQRGREGGSVCVCVAACISMCPYT